MIGNDKIYNIVECTDCDTSFYTYEEKEYLLETHVENEYPVDKLKPLCHFCNFMNMSASSRYNYLYVFTKVGL